MKFVHTADWQLGARFSQFKDKSDLLREARFKTLERTLKLAEESGAEFFLVAGDLFEDNQVDESIVSRAMRLFADFSSFNIYILPGNHDPYSGPSSVWNRSSVLNVPSHVRIFKEPEYIELSQGFLLASPIRQKKSAIDPSLQLDPMARELPKDAFKIGMTHGSPAIAGKHQSNDFPIDPEAATRGGLNYLALGHWHGWVTFDNNKIVMPGSPEPDRFDQDKSGYVAVVEVGARGELHIERKQVATLQWISKEVEIRDESTAEASLNTALDQLPTDMDHCVFRLVLKGRIAQTQAVELEKLSIQKLEPCRFAQVWNLIDPALTEAELKEIRSQSPLLAQIMNDLSKMESIITGENMSDISFEDSEPLTLNDFKEICRAVNLDQDVVTQKEIHRTRQLILQHLTQVS